MAILGYTFLDALQAAWVFLNGQKYAETEVGADVIKTCINRAQAEVPASLGSLMFAGALYSSYTFPALGSVDIFDMSAATDPVLVPCAAEVQVNTTSGTWGTAGFALPERILALARTAIGSSRNFSYGFLGKKMMVRPYIPAGGAAILHYLKVPTTLVQDADPLTCDPRLFRSVCLYAAWLASQKIPGIPAERIDTLQKDSMQELGRLESLIAQAKVEEYVLRTGREEVGLPGGGQ